MRRPAAIVLAVILMFVALASDAWGQSSRHSHLLDTPGVTPTPTTTQPATPPVPADQLAAEADRALIKAGTVHVAGKATVTEKGVSRTVTTSGEDLDLPQLALKGSSRLTQTRLSKQPHTTKRGTLDLIVVNTMAATRINGGAWQCDRFREPLLAGNGPLDPSNLGSQIVYANPAAAMINAVPVWVIKGSASTTAGGGTLTTTTELFISQTDDTVLREVTKERGHIPVKLHGKTRRVAITGTSTDAFSAYGESVTVTLPPECDTSAGGLQASATEFFLPGRGTLQPAGFATGIPGS